MHSAQIGHINVTQFAYGIPLNIKGLVAGSWRSAARRSKRSELLPPEFT
jgi:hypothetical protein